MGGVAGNPGAADSIRPRISWAMGIALVFFMAMAPELRWMEFSDGIENLNIETALEMRRGGPWLVPTLMGDARIRKPPLNAWITASSVQPQTVRDMSNPDPNIRKDAWVRLAWQVRWPALAAACLTLAFACELGWTLLGPFAGAGGAIIAGTMLTFSQQARWATTDVHLGLWVTVANLCLAKMVFERRIWLGLIGTGAALGLAFMSKGPVGLLMTVVPVTVFAIGRKYLASPKNAGARINWIAISIGSLIGLILFAAIGLTWFAYVASHNANSWLVWMLEVMRADPSEVASAHWYQYIIELPHFLPWLPLILVGLWQVGRMVFDWRLLDPKRRDRALRLMYAATLFVLPLLIMSFFRDRKPRYLYPFAIPAGILAAEAIRNAGRYLLTIHWGVILAMAIGYPIMGALGVFNMVRVDGQPWYSTAFGISVTVVMAMVVAVFILLSWKDRQVAIIGSGAVMLLSLAIYVWGARRSLSGNGVSEMLPLAQVIWEQYPTAEAWDLTETKRIPTDLAIYLNRPTHMPRTLARIRRNGLPQVIVMLQRQDASLIAPPQGWTYLTKVPRDKDWWVAFVRE